MTVFETERLAFRELGDGDLDVLTAMFADPEVMRYIGRGGVRTREDAAAVIERERDHYRNQGYGEWATLRRDDGQMIGLCGIIRWPDIDGAAEIEVAYLLARSAWGQGLGTEAAIGIRDWARRELGCERLVSLVYRDNAASIAVACKAGASWEKDVAFGDTHLALYAYAD